VRAISVVELRGALPGPLVVAHDHRVETGSTSSRRVIEASSSSRADSSRVRSSAASSVAGRSSRSSLIGAA
jgi:hypothetical protein